MFNEKYIIEMKKTVNFILQNYAVEGNVPYIYTPACGAFQCLLPPMERIAEQFFNLSFNLCQKTNLLKEYEAYHDVIE